MASLLLYMETSKAWVHLFLSHIFDSANPKNSLTFWSLMIGMCSLPALISPTLQEALFSLAAEQHTGGTLNWMVPEYLVVHKLTVTIRGDV